MLERGVVGGVVELRGLLFPKVTISDDGNMFIVSKYLYLAIFVSIMRYWSKLRKNECWHVASAETVLKRGWSNLGVVTSEILNFWWLERVPRVKIPLFRHLLKPWWLKLGKFEFSTSRGCFKGAWSHFWAVNNEILNFWWLECVSRVKIPLFRCQTWI